MMGNWGEKVNGMVLVASIITLILKPYRTGGLGKGHIQFCDYKIASFTGHGQIPHFDICTDISSRSVS